MRTLIHQSRFYVLITLIWFVPVSITFCFWQKYTPVVIESLSVFMAGYCFFWWVLDALGWHMGKPDIQFIWRA